MESPALGTEYPRLPQLHRSKSGRCWHHFSSLGIKLSYRTDSSLGEHFITGGELVFMHTSCAPLEFRSRQTAASTGSSSVFPPAESSGPLATFSGEPIPGTTPSIPMGAQQAGEATEKHQGSSIHRPGRSRAWELDEAATHSSR